MFTSPSQIHNWLWNLKVGKSTIYEVNHAFVKRNWNHHFAACMEVLLQDLAAHEINMHVLFFLGLLYWTCCFWFLVCWKSLSFHLCQTLSVAVSSAVSHCTSLSCSIVLVESVREGLAIFLQLEPSVLTAISNRFQALNNDPHRTGIEAMQSWPEDVTALEARH